MRFHGLVLNWQPCDGMLKALRYFHTLRYLRPVQVFGRFRFRLYRPRPDLSLPPFHPPVVSEPVAWSSCPPRMTGPDSFIFLNKEGNLARGWDSPEQSKLWRYNLHYFDDLSGDGAAGRQQWHRTLVERWIAENPPGMGSGWEPYPLSLRIVNWIKWLLAGNEPVKELANSLYLQAWYLRRRLEFHLLGNHLFANAKALVFAGLFFKGVEAEKWLKKGLQILAREVPEQILADGGHFERSPMYQSIILEDLMDLINIMRTYGQPPSDIWLDSAQKMLLWLKVMCHPDGQISFFNDAAIGIAAEPGKIEKYALRLGLSAIDPSQQAIMKLEDSGYVRLQKGSAVLIADVGRIGPDYLPGHAHADTLSFELSLKGKRVFVNSGTSCYGNSTERLAQRGTACHNTMMIDSKDSSEVWGGFRVARRAYPLEMETEDRRNDGLWLTCAHNGYRRLRGKPMHYREWLLTGNSLEIRDRIRGSYSEALVFYHLYPGLTVDLHTKKICSDDTSITYETDGDVSVKNKYYYPEFGISIPNECLVVRPFGNECRIKFKWH